MYSVSQTFAIFCIDLVKFNVNLTPEKLRIVFLRDGGIIYYYIVTIGLLFGRAVD